MEHLVLTHLKTEWNKANGRRDYTRLIQLSEWMRIASLEPISSWHQSGWAIPGTYLESTDRTGSFFQSVAQALSVERVCEAWSDASVEHSSPQWIDPFWEFITPATRLFWIDRLLQKFDDKPVQSTPEHDTTLRPWWLSVIQQTSHEIEWWSSENRIHLAFSLFKDSSWGELLKTFFDFNQPEWYFLNVHPSPLMLEHLPSVDMTQPFQEGHRRALGSFFEKALIHMNDIPSPLHHETPLWQWTLEATMSPTLESASQKTKHGSRLFIEWRDHHVPTWTSQLWASDKSLQAWGFDILIKTYSKPHHTGMDLEVLWQAVEHDVHGVLKDALSPSHQIWNLTIHRGGEYSPQSQRALEILQKNPHHPYHPVLKNILQNHSVRLFDFQNLSDEISSIKHPLIQYLFEAPWTHDEHRQQLSFLLSHSFFHSSFEKVIFQHLQHYWERQPLDLCLFAFCDGKETPMIEIWLQHSKTWQEQLKKSNPSSSSSSSPMLKLTEWLRTLLQEYPSRHLKHTKNISPALQKTWEAFDLEDQALLLNAWPRIESFVGRSPQPGMAIVFSRLQELHFSRQWAGDRLETPSKPRL